MDIVAGCLGRRRRRAHPATPGGDGGGAGIPLFTFAAADYADTAALQAALQDAAGPFGYGVALGYNAGGDIVTLDGGVQYNGHGTVKVLASDSFDLYGALGLGDGSIMRVWSRQIVRWSPTLFQSQSLAALAGNPMSIGFLDGHIGVTQEFYSFKFDDSGNVGVDSANTGVIFDAYAGAPYTTLDEIRAAGFGEYATLAELLVGGDGDLYIRHRSWFNGVRTIDQKGVGLTDDHTGFTNLEMFAYMGSSDDTNDYAHIAVVDAYNADTDPDPYSIGGVALTTTGDLASFPKRPVSLAVSPGSITGTVGDTVPVTVTALDRSSNPAIMPHDSIFLTSDDTSVATYAGFTSPVPVILNGAGSTLLHPSLASTGLLGPDIPVTVADP